MRDPSDDAIVQSASAYPRAFAARLHEVLANQVGGG